MPDEPQDAPTERFEFRPDEPALAGEGPFPGPLGDAASRLPSRYVVEAEIGRGGMGTVYRVRDRILRRRIAVKVLHVSLAEREDSRDRFIEEAQVASQLQHPNIVPVYDVGLDGPDAHPYFTMRLVDGQTLTGLLERRARGEGPSLVRLLQIFLDVCRAVHYAHAKGVLHRDLKPDNVMVGPFGEVYVMDWGVAKLVGSAAEGVSTRREKDRKESGVVSSRSISGEATWDGVVVGTPAFMPPEQAEGDIGSLGPWSDVYALGAILYKVLTLRAPYTGDTASEILRRVQAESPERPRKVRRDVPRDLEAICLKAMAREPRDRYTGPDALAEDIQRWFEGEQVRARPVPPLERVARWAHRRRYAIIAGVVLALAAMAMSYLLRWTVSLPRRQVVVVSVEPGSVAEEVGLKGGDVILRYGDLEVGNANDLAAAIHGSERSGAASVRLVLRRDTVLLERDVRPGRLGIRTMNVLLYLKEK